MEVIKYALIPMVWGISSLCVILNLISFLIRKLCKKDTHKTKRKLIRATVCAIITFSIICTYDRAEETIEPSEQELIESTHEQNIITISIQATGDTSVLGYSKDAPIVITANELALEIEANIDSAKEKYNGKWVEITGTISDTSDGGVMYGYYLHGKRATSGYTGLRIMCWCEDGPYSGSVLGDTQTFVGQVLEITTVNVTEIVDCERITE